jgi:surface-anchored protein
MNAMNLKPLSPLCIAMLASVTAPAAIGATSLYTAEFGHTHIGLNFGVNPPDPRDRDGDPSNDVGQFLNNDGGLFPHFADSSSAPPSNLLVDGPYGPEQVTIRVGAQTQTTRPSAPQLDAALGVAAGEPVWVLPELLDDALALNTLWLSPEVEEDAYDQFDDPDNDPLTGNVLWTLEGVSGPGELALWIADPSDPFGGIELWMGSADGIDGDDAVELFAGDRHNSWAFTAPGVYEVTFGFEASVNGQAFSEQATFTFEVVPTPGGAALLAFAGLAVSRRRR